MRWLLLLLAAPAAAAPLAWDIRESRHPRLGDIRYAYTHRPIETRAGSATVYSRAYFSCQKGIGKLALELVNSTAPAEPAGLRPATEPRLVCSRPVDGRLEREPLLATWEVNDRSGDLLARGLRPFPLRECASIAVIQEVLLPPGQGAGTARVEFELLPASREIDTVFVACGERSAAAPGTPAPPAAPAPAAETPGWQTARVVASGKTNVRAGPSLRSAIVAQLHPGAFVRVQRAEGDWWPARPIRGDDFEGYIRADRLAGGSSARHSPSSPLSDLIRRSAGAK